MSNESDLVILIYSVLFIRKIRIGFYVSVSNYSTDNTTLHDKTVKTLKILVKCTSERSTRNTLFSLCELFSVQNWEWKVKFYGFNKELFSFISICKFCTRREFSIMNAPSVLQSFLGIHCFSRRNLRKLSFADERRKISWDAL